MISCARFLLVSSVVLAGCQTAERVAVTSFRVLDAPARYIRDRIDPPQTTTTTTTTTQRSNRSDVATPGRPVNVPPPTSTQRRVATQTRPRETTPSSRLDSASSVQRKPSPSPSPRTGVTQPSQFPTAKPVPGKPGYVYSVDPKGGIVDVTGYKSGDKAKDPYTQQIFIVP